MEIIVKFEKNIKKERDYKTHETFRAMHDM